MLLPTLALIFLWLQLFWSLVPTWINGQYYEYGWFVPVLAVALAASRLSGQSTAKIGPESPILKNRISSLAVGIMLSVIGLIALLRLISIADPSWRPPLILHALIVASCTHFWIGTTLGWKTSRSLLPVTLFTLSSVPIPYQAEQWLIGNLTSIVARFTHELLILQGYPVDLRGITLFHGTQIVEVSEGCSGIRSFQSLLMVALFFGELLLLPWFSRLLLVANAAIFAFGVNMLRAYLLSTLHFSHGSEFANRQHDSIGNYAFVISSILLFVAAKFLLPASKTSGILISKSTTSPP